MNIEKYKNWDHIIKGNRSWFHFNITEIWTYRYLTWLFIKRDFTTFYKQTILGPLWFFIQPIITTVVFSIIFNRIAKIPTNGIPPILFYMSGIIAWNYFSTCLNSTSSTFTANASLFGKVYFPRIIMPISKIISSLAKFGVQLFMFLGFYLYFIIKGNSNIQPNFFLLLMIISSLTIKYRDLHHLVSFGTQLLMYATPIVYPLSSVPDKYKFFIIMNPMTPIINIFREAFISQGSFDISILTSSILTTFILFVLGFLLFNKFENNFIDTV